jgi:hypothetical protein
MTRNIIAIGGLVLLVLSACMNKPTEQQFAATNNLKPLIDEQVKAVFAGNTITGSSHGGTYTVFYDASGQERGIWSKGTDKDSDTGTWTARADGQFCEKWSKWEKAEEKCWRLYRTADGKIAWFTPDGTDDTGDTVFLKGNSANL